MRLDQTLLPLDDCTVMKSSRHEIPLSIFKDMEKWLKPAAIPGNAGNESRIYFLTLNRLSKFENPEILDPRENRNYRKDCRNFSSTISFLTNHWTSCLLSFSMEPTIFDD